MSRLHPVLHRLRGGLIASAQAYPGEPMRDPRTMDPKGQARIRVQISAVV